MVPSDEQSLLKIWKDADFSRPADLKDTAEAPKATAGTGTAPRQANAGPSRAPVRRAVTR
jgi:hypothetical protein